MTNQTTTTIYAESTPKGFGGISVIRLSGPQTIPILNMVSDMSAWKAHMQRLVMLKDRSGRMIDQVMIVLHPAPHSYTGEDLAEISCHGNPLVVQAVLEAVKDTGLALPAGRGEFTRRAYQNGKLDLPQAEAVGALIEARSLRGLSMAKGLMSGALSIKLRRIMDIMQTIEAEIEASFLEEDLAIDPPSQGERLAAGIAQMEDLLQGAEDGPGLYKGITTVIAGAPNAGKSSLFNALLGFERAIVHEEAGTTRDIITEHVIVSGIDFIFHDTAGIREISTGPERAGIERTMAALKEADLILYVVDAQRGLTPDEATWLNSGKTIVVLNKIDLCPQGCDDIPGYVNARVSAKYREGIDTLAKAMQQAFPQELPQVFLARHRALLSQALQSLQMTLSALEDGLALDVLTIDLKDALGCLKALLGEETSSDILDRVFATFCVGK